MRICNTQEIAGRKRNKKNYGKEKDRAKRNGIAIILIVSEREKLYTLLRPPPPLGSPTSYRCRCGIQQLRSGHVVADGRMLILRRSLLDRNRLRHRRRRTLGTYNNSI